MYVAPRELKPLPNRERSDSSHRVDAPAFCKAPKRRRFRTCEAPTLFPQQSQASNQRCEMDARRPTTVDRLEYWRVYALEWHGLQLRDDLAGK